MSQPAPQTFENHTRFVPFYHFVSAPIFLLNLVWSFYLLVTEFSVHTVIAALVAFALWVFFLFARYFALSAQERVIRLEERLRMRELLPADLQGNINDFTTGQLIALRFASDAELPDLARQVLEEYITKGKEIKKRIQTWRLDYQRV